MSFRLIGAGIAVVGLGVVYLGIMVDRSVNYKTVTAQIVSLDTSCSLEKREYRRRKWTNSRPCSEVEQVPSNDPEYAGFTVKRQTVAEVVYYSPVDGAQHEGKLTDSTTGDTAGFGGKHEGEQFEILAHTTNAEKIQKL